MSSSVARDLRAVLSGQVLEDEAARIDRSGDFGHGLLYISACSFAAGLLVLPIRSVLISRFQIDLGHIALHHDRRAERT